MIINVNNTGAKKYALLVYTNPKALVDIEKSGISHSVEADSHGHALFSISAGAWTITASNGSVTKSTTSMINLDTCITLMPDVIPKFEYTGDYEVTNEGGDDWNIKFKTNGTFKFTELGNAQDGIDVFLVGGGAGGEYALKDNGGSHGGGGGGGAYSATHKGITVVKNQSYDIVIGAGGTGGYSSSHEDGNDGGATTAFGLQANGGSGSSSTDRTTYAFNEGEGETYGSAGAYRSNATAGRANSGNGGNGGTPKSAGGQAGGKGGSGVVIIRNTRS